MRKYSSSGAASTVLFAYDQAGQLLGEYDNTGNALREYIWLEDTPVALFTPDPANPVANPPVAYFIQADHLNTPRVVLSKSNQVRWRWLAEPFGTTAPETNPSALGAFTQNLRFPGQYADSETGLSYNTMRDYDATLGRYVQSDPIGLAGGINTYAYVGGNPVGRIDPIGLCPWCLIPALPGVGEAVLAVGAWLASHNTFQDKTPNSGDPGNWHTNPGSGQERLYGPDGRPSVDIDWDHDHQNDDGTSSGSPHGHNWDWSKKPPRSFPVPISPWPRGRICPTD